MNIEQIDPTKELNLKEFCALFDQLPLNDEEKKEVKETYWGVYKVCLDHPEVDPTKAWLATRNTFIALSGELIKKRLNL